MRKLILSFILMTIFSFLSLAQEKATVWLYGSKTDVNIIKKKQDIEAMGFKVFVNDNVEREKRHSVKNTDSGDEKFDRIFREGRELMDKEDWAKAAAKFSEIACDCPENKQVDAALYWLAYCYKKQKMYKEATETINRLLKNFPNSAWSDDGRVMQYELSSWRPVTGVATVGRPSVSRPVSVSRNTSLPAQGVGLSSSAERLAAEQYWSTVNSSNEETKLEREDEIKLAAFQSLVAVDIKRAIEKLGELLKSDSKASESLKRQVIRSFRGSRYYVLDSYSTNLTFATTASGQQSSASSNAEKNAERQQNQNLLRETLVRSFQNEPNIKIRSEIIYSIASMSDDQSSNYLIQLYSSEGNKELKKSIISAFGGGTYLFYPDGFHSTAAIAPSSQSSVRKVYSDKLWEIIRTEKDLELKRLALSNAQSFSGWSSREGAIETLSQLYDSETDQPFKVVIIQSFSRLKENKQAVNKLIDIAKNDKSDELRLLAIKSLRNNSSPEVIKLLEGLIN